MEVKYCFWSLGGGMFLRALSVGECSCSELCVDIEGNSDNDGEEGSSSARENSTQEMHVDGIGV